MDMLLTLMSSLAKALPHFCEREKKYIKREEKEMTETSMRKLAGMPRV